MTAREPNQAPIFNHASMAHNNHFFFQGLAPGGTPMPDDLRRELEASFSSIDSLRLEFIVTASAMFGPGFVWLVKAGPGDYRLLPTYLAGSPYPGAHWRMQSTDMNTVGNDGSARPFLRNQLLGAGRRRTGDLPPGGIELEPLLCLNTWEHAWLLDWGMGVDGKGGKAAYVDAWWNSVDWEKVHQRAGTVRPEFMTENSP
jgi:Fe-Mn family superoxide dismutase